MPDTLFSAVLRQCGLSQREAADFLGVRPDTVKSWSAGRNRAPDGAWSELRALDARIEEAATQAAEQFEEMLETEEPVTVEIGIASDDHEAQGLGWPCVGVQMAMAARLWAMLPEGVTVRLVPRGSTVAAAGAADAHDRVRPARPR